jgi:hypothetical protein
MMTLFEAGHYEIGAMTLYNSLARSGYRGTLWCGVRGQPVHWTEGVSAQCLDVDVQLVPTDPARHLMNYKADFMLSIAERVPDARALVYIDPDVVIKCSWSEIEDWCVRGIAAVGDQNWLLPASSPVRARWRELRDRLSVPVVAGETSGSLDIYCNSGFVGVPRTELAFLVLWRDLMESALSLNVYGDAEVSSYLKALGHLDQELFNIALMSFTHCCSLRGPEAMDFAPGGETLSHSTGSPKPWEKNFVRRALLGNPPSKIDREFLRYCTSPLPALDERAHRRRLASYIVGRTIGAFFRRSDH